MQTKKRLAACAALGTIALAACGSKTDANEKNFGAALTQYFERAGELCLGTGNWPVDVSKADKDLQKMFTDGTANQMAALQAVGLAKAEDIEVQGKDFGGQPDGFKHRVTRYTLTDAAKPFVREKEVTRIGLGPGGKVKQTDLCWGRKVLDKVVKWEGPIKLGDYQEARVTYTYKIIDLADWARRPELQAAYVSVKRLIDGAGTYQDKHGLKLTSQGWEARGLD